MAMEAKRLDRRYTVDDYMLWEGDWELHDGVPVQLHPPHPEDLAHFRQGMVMSPSPIGPHQKVVGNIYRGLAEAIERNSGTCPCHVLPDVDWRISELTVVRPDISVICGGELPDYIERPPSLIVEVGSPSTRRRDRDVKLRLYAREGVTLYLLADPEQRQAELRRLDASGAYVEERFEFDLHPGCRIHLDEATFWRGLPPR